MIPKEIGLTITVDRVGEMVKAVEDLTKRKLLIGIPAEEAERDPKDGDAITNAQIGYMNETGIPERNLPARPHLVPGVTAYKEDAIVRLKNAAKAALENRPAAAAKQFDAMGLEAVSAVRAKLTEGVPPPLSPKTIAARKRAGFMGTTPLIRTADYLRHISYVIIEKAKRTVVTPSGGGG